MRIVDWLLFIKTSLLVNKTRSLLTLLGVAIGVMSVSLLTAIGEGVNHYVNENFSQFGSRIIGINPGKDLSQSMGGIISSTKPLSLEDAYALKQIQGVENIAAMVQGVGEMKYQQKHRNSEIIGTTSSMAKMFNFKVQTGTFLPLEQGYSRPFVVLGAKMKQELFANRNAIGEFIRVAGQRFRVIGIMEAKGQMLGIDLDDIVYIPADRALSLFNRTGLMEIDVTYSQHVSSEHIAEKIKDIMMQRHGSLDVTITTQDQMLETLDSILTSITAGIGLIGSVSLFVGGVGIYTIMTIAIEERTAEVGLLKAIGASNRQVVGLFLGEAILFGCLGGLLGLVLSVIISVSTILLVPDFPLYPHFGFILLSLFISLFIGLVAGVRPAYKASKLNPVMALRVE